MHLGNGAITPECAVLTFAAAAAGLATCAAAARREGITRDKLLLTASLGSLVFAAQALNMPVWPGIGAHLVGGVLIASVVGPGLGAWTMASVLAIQALALGDGGWAALGANVLNMALMPAGLVAIARRLGIADRNSGRSIAIVGVAAAVAVPLAAALIVIETALFRPVAELANWTSFAPLMLATHLWIGVLEGVATVALIAAFHWIGARGAYSSALRPSWCCMAAAIVLATFFCPWSSDLPDGYEASAIASGQQQLLAE